MLRRGELLFYDSLSVAAQGKKPRGSVDLNRAEVLVALGEENSAERGAGVHNESPQAGLGPRRGSDSTDDADEFASRAGGRGRRSSLGHVAAPHPSDKKYPYRMNIFPLKGKVKCVCIACTNLAELRLWKQALDYEIAACVSNQLEQQLKRVRATASRKR